MAIGDKKNKGENQVNSKLGNGGVIPVGEVLRLKMIEFLNTSECVQLFYNIQVDERGSFNELVQVSALDLSGTDMRLNVRTNNTDGFNSASKRVKI